MRTRVDPTEKQAEPKSRLWRTLAGKSRLWRTLIGWTCLVIGVIGIILPIIPGIPFLVVGLAALSTEYRWVRSLLIWMKRKMGRFWPQKIKIPQVPRKGPGPKDRPL